MNLYDGMTSEEEDALMANQTSILFNDNNKLDLAAMSIEQLDELKDNIDKEKLSREAASKAEGLARIKALASEYGISMEDALNAPEKTKKPVAPKYADGKGNTWTGRGRKPKWIENLIASGIDINYSTNGKNAP